MATKTEYKIVNRPSHLFGFQKEEMLIDKLGKQGWLLDDCGRTKLRFKRYKTIKQGY